MSRQLRRLRNRLGLDRRRGWIGGVCAGLAGFFGIEPIYVRGAVVIAGVLFTKTVIVVYVVLWMLLYQRKGDGESA